MVKKSIIQRESKRRYFVDKYSSLRKFLKGKVKSSNSFEQKLFYHSQLQSLPRNSSFSRLV